MESDSTSPKGLSPDLAKWLWAQGWEVTSLAPLEAERTRGERAEALAIDLSGRCRYTVTRRVGDEDVERLSDGSHQAVKVTILLSETTVTARGNPDDPADLRAVIALISR